MPLVSVIIPTHNRAHILPRTIKSVLAQTFCDFELIVSDDGSTDNTPDVVGSFTDPRIRYIRHEQSQGAAAARSAGVLAAQGRYIAPLDDTDEWFPQKLQKQIEKFNEVPDSVGVINGGHVTVSQKTGKEIYTYIPIHRGKVFPETLKSGLGGGSSMFLIKRECFDTCGLFDGSFASLEAAETWIRISMRYEFEIVPEVLGVYYAHKKKNTQELKRIIAAREKLIAKYRDELLKYPDCFADQLNWLSIIYGAVGDLVKAKASLIGSIQQKPIQFSVFIRLLQLVVAPAFYQKKTEQEIWKKYNRDE